MVDNNFFYNKEVVDYDKFKQYLDVLKKLNTNKKTKYILNNLIQIKKYFSTHPSKKQTYQQFL